MAKRWTWEGVVKQQKKVHVVKSKVEGKGKNKQRVTIEEDQYVVQIANEDDGTKASLSQRLEAFGMVPGEDVSITVTYGQQETIEDATQRVEKKGKVKSS